MKSQARERIVGARHAPSSDGTVGPTSAARAVELPNPSQLTPQLMKKVCMLIAPLLGTVLLFGAVPVQAQLYDFVADYSIVSNPNGAWSYGWAPFRGGPVTLMDRGWTDYGYYGTQDVWSPSADSPSPSIALAVTDINHPTLFVPAGTVNTHPGYNGESPVVRWTASASGTYKIEGHFIGNDHGWDWQDGVTTTTDVAVLRGPLEVFSGYVESYDVPLPFSLVMPLLAGETIDLTVGFGRNGSYWHDSTGLAATITKVSDLACTPPPAGTIAWWPGDDNANDIINGNNGIPVGDVRYGPGIAEKAFEFTGGQDIDQGVDVPAAPVLDVTTAITIAAWIKPLGDFAPIVEYKAPDYPNQPFGIHFWQYSANGRPDSLYANLVDANHAYHQLWAEGTLTVGQWNHVAMTYDQTGYCSLYVNGMQVATQFFGVFEMKTDKGLYIGYRPETPYDGWYSFNGGIDEVAIFNRALTEEEVSAVYLTGSAGMCKQIPVTIDIMPGGFPNSINPRSEGVIPVAILTTATFDAATVDAATVRFGAGGNEAPAVQSGLEDVDGDGHLDSILHFRTQQTGIVCGTTSGILTGITTGGQLITGTDSMATVGCK